MTQQIRRDPVTVRSATLRRMYRSPALLLAVLAVSVFISETVVMIALRHFGLLDHPIQHLLDSLILIVLLTPMLILLVFRPLHFHLSRSLRAEEELAAERNKLMGILDAMPAGVCILSQSYVIEYANAALTAEFGPVNGRACFEYFHDRQTICSDCRLMEVCGGKSDTWEWHSHLTGKTYEIFDTPLKNADGSVARLALMRDITARKLAADELRASRERLRSLSDHLQRAREEERRAIGREIHDELGQVLATVQLGVSSLVEDCCDHRQLAEKIDGMVHLISGAIKTVQRISSRLRPAILDELGLAEAIEWQVSEFAKHTGIYCSRDIHLEGITVESKRATALFRICQEALTNVMRHAEANHVDVSISERKGRIVLIVRDDGRGITPEELHGSRSLGIIGMRERAYVLGGRVRICRWFQQGTVVIAHIPINSSGAGP